MAIRYSHERGIVLFLDPYFIRFDVYMVTDEEGLQNLLELGHHSRNKDRSSKHNH